MAQAETTGGKVLTLVDAVSPASRSPARSSTAYPDAGFEAQLLGQPYQRRGLRGGAPVLEAARGAYLSAEYAGEGDRRPAPGLLTVREI